MDDGVKTVSGEKGLFDLSFSSKLQVSMVLAAVGIVSLIAIINQSGGVSQAVQEGAGQSPLLIASLIFSCLSFFWTVYIYMGFSAAAGQAVSLASSLAHGNTSTTPAATGDREFSDEMVSVQNSLLKIRERLEKIASAADGLAQGDLTMDFRPVSQDDRLGKAFADMIGSVSVTIKQLSDALGIVGRAVDEIMISVSQSASGASQTAAAVTETTTTVEQVRQTSHLASQKAQYVLLTAEKTAQITSAGKQATEETISGMKRIREQMNLIAESMVKLSEKSQSIVEIIQTVDDLSQQSNLLAVNAAIEAANAGEFGKGFIVVAEEVRNMADQSKQATAQVSSILTDIQRAINSVAMATELGSKAVDAALVHSSRAGESINSLGHSVHESAQAATQIALSSKEQLIGVDQIATAMQGIRDATQQNMESVGLVETAAMSLKTLGVQLDALVQRYKV